MADGVRSTNFPTTAIIDELIGNRNGSTIRIPAEKFALQLLSSGPMQALTGAGGGVKLFPTYANLAAATVGDYTPWVYADPDPAKNGIYRRVAPNWVWSLPLPYSLIRAEDEGEGSANAIRASTKIPVSEAALISLNVFETNTGPATVSFNDGPAHTIKTNSGNDVAPGGLIAGMIVLGTIDGETFRLVNDQVSSAVVAQAEAEADRSEAARDAALSAVPNAFPGTRSALKALDTSTVTSAFLKELDREGQFAWRTGNFSAQIAADPYEALYIKADAVSASVGAWVRQGDWAVIGKSIRWAGASSQNLGPDNALRIQSLLDMKGTTLVPDDPLGPYPVGDWTLLLRSDTTLRWTGNTFLKLTSSTNIGGMIAGYYQGPFGEPAPHTNSENILVDNPLVDCDGWGELQGANYGENGVAGAFVTNMRIRGGIIKNCRNGKSAWSGTGGRALQFDGSCKDCRAEGTIVMDCHAAMAAAGTTSTPEPDIVFSNITAIRCDGVIQTRHTASPPTNGVQYNSFAFINITASNCGKTTGYWATQGAQYQVGAIQIDRANNTVIRNFTLWNEAAYGSIAAVISHFRGNYNTFDVTFSGDCTNLINSSTFPFGFGSTGTRNSCLYEIKHMLGSADRAIITAGADAANHGANVYKIKTATLVTELFDSNSAQPDLFGYFLNQLGDKSIEGAFINISSIYSRNYPATFDRATIGSLQLNNLYVSFGSSGGKGFQVMGTVAAEDFIMTRNQQEKIRLTENGFRASIPVYANNAAAIAGGLIPGDAYKTSTGAAFFVT